MSEESEVDPTLSQGEHEEPQQPLGPMIDGKPVSPDLPLDSGPEIAPEPDSEAE